MREEFKPFESEITKFVDHTLGELATIVEQHRKLVSSNALAGIKPNGEVESEFYKNVDEFRKLLMKVKHNSVEDLEHVGDKNWEKHYPDGII